MNNVPGSVPLGGLLGPRGPGDNGGASALSEQKMIQYMQSAMESCPAKTVLSGTMGFGLGAMFGLFMSSMRYDTPMSSPAAQAVTSLPMRQQLSTGLKDMGRASISSAKNFGKVGAIFSGSECCIEGLRAKNELSNGVAAGCITGGILARSGGPQAVALGCGGFALFSAAIDTYMRQPSETGVGRIE